MFIFFGALSGFLSIFCYFPYIRDMLLHKTKPERTSWLIWCILTGIAFFSQLAKGASYSLLQPGFEFFGITIVFLLSLQLGVGGFTKKDYIALTAALIGLILWYLTEEAAIALFIVILIDAAGAILTIDKAYQSPESETFSTWILASLAGMFSMIAVGKLNPILLIYPFYIFFINGATALAMLISPKK